MPINIATILTLIRIALIPVLVAIFYSGHVHRDQICAFVFMAASITDWLDGYLARKYQLESAFGAFLDPVADKLMVATVLILLVQRDPTPLLAIIGAVIIGREISISALREWMAEIGKRARVAVAAIGKIKTIAQMTALSLLLYRHHFLGLPIYKIGEVCLGIAAVLTLYSAAQYLLSAMKALNETDS